MAFCASKRERVMEFDPFSGSGLDTLELVAGAVHQQVRNGATVGGLLRQPERHRLGFGDAAQRPWGSRS